MDSPAAIRITKRLVLEMVNLATSEAFNKTNLLLFEGMGLALAMCFEELTTNSARNRKPREIMQWAMELPSPPLPPVGPKS